MKMIQVVKRLRFEGGVAAEAILVGNTKETACNIAIKPN